MYNCHTRNDLLELKWSVIKYVNLLRIVTRIVSGSADIPYIISWYFYQYLVQSYTSGLYSNQSLEYGTKITWKFILGWTWADRHWQMYTEREPGLPTGMEGSQNMSCLSWNLTPMWRRGKGLRLADRWLSIGLKVHQTPPSSMERAAEVSLCATLHGTSIKAAFKLFSHWKHHTFPKEGFIRLELWKSQSSR